jgi:hypothetical protein
MQGTIRKTARHTIPRSFSSTPESAWPIVATYMQFLRMLDGTLQVMTSLLHVQLQRFLNLISDAVVHRGDSRRRRCRDRCL